MRFMKKTAVVYWSGTGNTQAMAEAVLEGAQSAGAQAELFTAAEFTADNANSYDTFAFGCPSMGAEQLEESEFEPMFSDVLPHLSGKSVGLFGSYGWGDGEWMRSWTQQCTDAGCRLIGDSVICNDAPDDEALENCRALGAACGS